jgi:hypothetical protein
MAKKYTGILATPIIIGDGPFGKVLGKNQNVEAERLKRVAALFSHYKIKRKSPNAIAKLMLCLAIDHVPGFREIDWKDALPKGGVKKTWNATAHLELYLEVGKITARGKSARSALQILLKNDKHLKYADVTLTTLYRQYMAAKKSPWVRIGGADSNTLSKLLRELRKFEAADDSESTDTVPKR